MATTTAYTAYTAYSTVLVDSKDHRHIVIGLMQQTLLVVSATYLYLLLL